MSIDKKRFETRGWGTSYRGPLAIHAAKKWNPELELLCATEPFKTVLYDAFGEVISLEIMPFGAILAVVDLYDCQKITKNPIFIPSSYEFAFGDYSVGRHIWKTRNVHRLERPIPYVGRQGLFEVPDNLMSQAF